MTGARGPSIQSLRIRGLVAVLLGVAIIAILVIRPFSGDDDIVEFAIEAPTLPDGIVAGLPVDIRGETVGTVCGLDVSNTDITRVNVCIKSIALTGLTQDTAVSFVSRNLFGSDALRLTPNGSGTPVSAGSVINLRTSPANYTMTATVRSAGTFTLPVLTPELSKLLTHLSDTTIRMSPFLTAGLVTLQAIERGQSTPLAALLPTAADAVNGVGEAGAGGIKGLELALTNPLLQDRPYVAAVASMIADIGDLFGGLGTLFGSLSALAPGLDMATAFTTPLTHALRDVTPTQVGGLIDNVGGAFRKDPKTGKTVLSMDVNLDIVPGVATPLNHLMSGSAGTR